MAEARETEVPVTTPTARRPRRKTQYLVLWWMAQTPYAALFDDRMAAETAANVRNALLVSISGQDVRIDAVSDWYRRNDRGEPMPAEWRDLVDQIHVARPRGGRASR